MNYITQIEKLGACEVAMAWLRNWNYPDLKSAWNECGNPGWMVWLLMRTSGDFKSESRKAVLRLLILFAQETYGEYESVDKTLRVMERWCEGIIDYDTMQREFSNTAHLITRSDRISVYISGLKTCTMSDPLDASFYSNIICIKHCEVPREHRVNTLEEVLRHFPNPPVIPPPARWSLHDS